MKEIVTCNLSDGIGKQLFQIAAVINYSKKYHKTPLFHHNVTSLVTDKVDLFSQDMLSNIKFENFVFCVILRGRSLLFYCRTRDMYDFVEEHGVPESVVNGISSLDNMVFHMKKLFIFRKLGWGIVRFF